MAVSSSALAFSLALTIWHGHLIVSSSGSCSCKGTGLGNAGLALGLPVEYGKECRAWEDGDCSAHQCGTATDCPAMWPNVQSGAWCCTAWCYVDASCTHEDVGLSSLVPDNGKPLYYSYEACSSQGSPKYTEATCPWNAELSWEAAGAAITVAEHVSQLQAHDGGPTILTTFSYSDKEYAVSSGSDSYVCLHSLRPYGATLEQCNKSSRVMNSLAATDSWIVGSSEGQTYLEVWTYTNDPIQLMYAGKIYDARPKPLQMVMYLPTFGLAVSSEDSYVSFWDLTGVNSSNTDSYNWTDEIGPFSRAPLALEEVSFGQNKGVAVADFADVQIWLKGAGGWETLSRLSGHSRMIKAMAFYPALGLLASASVDSNIAVWHYEAGEWQMLSRLYDHKQPVTSLAWISQGPLLASGDEESIILWRPPTSDTCGFNHLRSYYMAGFNRNEQKQISLSDCRQMCCEAPWCVSIDYDTIDKTCWLSSAGEGLNGGGGLVWDPEERFDYHEITKRGTRFMTVSQPRGINNLLVAPQSSLIMSTNTKDGIIDSYQLISASCPDGQRAKGEGTKCIDCDYGSAGLGGVCKVCRPGTVAAEEGLTECAKCPAGKFNDVVGSRRCYDCPQGTFADSEGTSSCRHCGEGFYNDAVGATSGGQCKRCGPGKFGASTRNKDCQSCPEGTSHDLYGSTSASPCEDCQYCGTGMTKKANESCFVPKSGTCVSCPPGMVKKKGGSSCEYCPWGQIPSSDGSICQQFVPGNFPAQNVQNRQCMTRDVLGDSKACPMMGSGWKENKEDDDRTTYHDMYTEDRAVCSALHCQGAYYYLNAVVERQKPGTCAMDGTLKDVCNFVKHRLNDKIDAHEKKSNQIQADKELLRRSAQCKKHCDCTQMCKDVTEEEQAKELAFDIDPFKVESCNINRDCQAVCTNAVKTIVRAWRCTDVEEVRDIFEKRMYWPRCEATCESCPKEKQQHDHHSFFTCDRGARVSAAARQYTQLSGSMIAAMLLAVLSR
eukprot:TRINITY_DN91251_c0_g1_i1.p1 TRINITY_DN91251_c0_g1~~TRINITY_DN91251_c0_g1_i1.p1  ORF type:complete len:1000 (-),score=142.16 TRINITY_DN91251_c0_g1_i1:81-3080(-)